MKPIFKRIAIALAAFFVVGGGALFFLYDDILNNMAKTLVREDIIQPSDAIVVLAGDRRGERMESGINLYKKGYGKYLVFWGGPIYWKISLAELALRQITEGGVPLEKVIFSEEKLDEFSTRGEANVNMRLLRENGIRSFILVTSPYHTARAASVYEKLINGTDMKMYIYPSIDTAVTLNEWWTDRYSAKMVYYELTKRLFYWLN
ncbi:MAG: YdcF family protein [Nitrospinota bacterium]